MNLRVDLILPTEQRSASVVNVKSLARIASIVVPAILGIVIALAVVNMIRYRSDLKDLEAQWTQTKPKKEAAAKLRTELAANQDLEKRLTAWTKSRLDWHSQLRGIQKEVQPELRIQLTSLTIGSDMTLTDKGTIPARIDTLILKGMAFGENTEANVQKFKASLQASPTLAGHIESMDITRFDASKASGANKLDRVFQIEAGYKARKFQ